MNKLFFLFAAGSGFTGVLLGAFAAHGLNDVLTVTELATFKTGVLYHFVHTLALLLLAVIIELKEEHRFFRFSGWSFIAGIFLFSGSLYLLSMTGIRFLGIITPIGGLAFLTGWFCLFLGIKKAF